MMGHCGVVIAPAALGFFARQFHHLGAADIRLQRAAFHVDAAPDDLARLADALEVPPPRRKYMGGWRSLTAPA
jgi:hypothetical protein